jgi:hypothetical protein
LIGPKWCARGIKIELQIVLFLDNVAGGKIMRLRVWINERLDTPEKARTVLSNIALGGGVIAAVLMLAGVLTAHGRGEGHTKKGEHCSPFFFSYM